MTDKEQRAERRVRISQETFAIVSVGAALAGLILVTTGDIRDEARADRAAWQAESRQLRDEARAAREASDRRAKDFRDEARAAREASDRKLEAFEREILRLTEGQARLAALATSPRPKDE